MAGSSATEYVFRNFRVSVERAQVCREGEQIAIAAKAVKLLVALIERRDRVVAKDELMDVVWPGVFVEEGNIKYQISTIRRALGQNVVQTVGKVGYQFVAPLESDARPAASTNLPLRSRPVIGRDDDAELLHSLLLEHPLVTLVGTGGVGKSTLARSIGRRMLDRLAGGVWLLEPPASLDADAVASALASVIGADLGKSDNPVDALARVIGGRRMLFILDGCDRVRTTIAAVVSRLLDDAPGLSILVTSRIPLKIPGERVMRLDPLGTDGEAGDAASASLVPAIALLLDRAEAADARFELDDRDATKAAELCRSLGGLPLALEIVATRLPILGFEALSGRLGEFSLQDSDPLRQALDLSWSLLTDRGKEALNRFSVLGGSFDLTVARALIGGELNEHALLGAISELADNSLLTVERGRPPRYRLLDTTRTFALQRQTPAQTHQLNQVVARHFVDKLAIADAAWNQRDEAEWREELQPDLDSIRGALGWAFAKDGDAAIGLRLAGSSAQLWSALSLFGEGQHWLELAIGVADDANEDPACLGAVWRGMAALCMHADSERAKAAFGRAAALYRKAGHLYGEGRALAGAGVMEMVMGGAEQAEQTLLRAAELLGAGERAKSYGSCLGALAFVYASTGRPVEAKRTLEEALGAVRKSRDLVMIGQTESNLAELAMLSSDPFSAVQRGEAAVDQLRRARNPRLLAWALCNLATYAEALGDVGRAREVAVEALPLARPRGDEILVGLVELVALLGLDSGSLTAARLLGWAETTKVRLARPRQPQEAAVYSKLIEGLRDRVSIVRLNSAMADGASWTIDEAGDAAMELIEDAVSTRPAKPHSVVAFVPNR